VRAATTPDVAAVASTGAEAGSAPEDGVSEAAG
jgi:hypothetical protein